MNNWVNRKQLVGGALILLHHITMTHASILEELPPCCPRPLGSVTLPHCRWVKCVSTHPPPTPSTPTPCNDGDNSIAGGATKIATATDSNICHPTTTETASTTVPASAIQCGRSNTGQDSSPQPCTAFNKDPCDCRANGCEYNPTDNNCYPGSKVCEACEINLPPSECRRSNSYYVHEGVVCKATKDSGNCSIAEVITAVNFGDTELTDSIGITYQSFYDVQPDILPENSRIGNSTNILTDQRVAPQDRKLYETFLFGSPIQPTTNSCLTYKIQINEDGLYEFTMKFFEYAAHLVGKRGFDIKLNGITISRELDIIGLTGCMQNALNLIANFRVDGERSILLLPGFPPTPMKNGLLVFELCNGACQRRSSWRIWTLSAFSLLKFAAHPPTPTTVAPPLVIPRDECDNVNIRSKEDPKFECLCHHQRCEFALGQRVCVNDTNACPPILKERSCHRAGGYFVQDGVVCEMERDDNCQIEDPVLAINVNGEAHTDKNGILYQAEQLTDYIYNYTDERRTESYADTLDTCSYEKERPDRTGNDASLYYTLVHGWSEDELRKPENCLHYPIRVEKDGTYELGMKFIEAYHTLYNSFFTVKLNNQTVLSRFDMVFHKGKKCVGMDVYLHFQIKGRLSTLQILGHTNSSIIQSNVINLSFCYGDLKTDCTKESPDYEDDGDPNYSISAFYVARFKNQTKF